MSSSVSWPEMDCFFSLFWVCIHNNTWLSLVLINLVVVTLLSHLRIHQHVIGTEAVAHRVVARWDFSTRGAVITLVMEFLNSIYCSNFLPFPSLLGVFPDSSSSKCPPLPSRFFVSNLKHGAGNTINHLAEWRQLDQLGCTKRGELKKDLSEAERQRARGEAGEKSQQ